MNKVKLKLNTDKTEFNITGDKHNRDSLIPIFSVIFLQSSIVLGVTCDSENIFDNHTGKVCHACYYHLRDLRHICVVWFC